MKTRIIILLLAVIALAACKQSEYPEVEQKFNEFVEENFGEPDDLKEIVSISIDDTLSSSTFIGMAKDAMTIDSLVEQDVDYFSKWIYYKESKKYLSKIRGERLSKFKRYLDDFIEHTSNGSYYINKKKLTDLLEEYGERNDFFIHYLVKARIEVGDNKEIREYHAYKDKNGKIVVQEHELNTDEGPSYWKEIGDATMRFSDDVLKRKETAGGIVATIKEVGGYFELE